MSKEISREEAALAWAQKRRVEAIGPRCSEWTIVQPLENFGTGGRWWVCGIFNCPGYLFRLAPEPPAKRYRPWTPEEVPVGALTRPKLAGDVLMIIGRLESGALLAGDTSGPYPLNLLLNTRDHSIDPIGTPDSKRTWLPCGVEVSE